MKTFVQEFVQSWIARVPNQWGNWTFVVPNKLVGFYVQKELRAQSQTTNWSPLICTLPELAADMSKFQLCSTTASIHHLLKAYNKAMPNGSNEIGQFIKWGQKLHTDFMDVAMSLADANQIYRDLRSIKEVEHWDIGDDALSGAQKKFMQFWNALEPMFTHWKEAQEKKGSLVYPVMLRWLLNNSRQWEEGWHGKSLALIGVAGLSRAEEMLLRMIKSRAHVEVNWDADRFYVGSDWHEAGWAIRQHPAWINPSDLGSSIASRPLKITHVKCESFHGQCAAIVEELRNRSNEEIKQTALLLPDETWLMPILRLLDGQELLGRNWQKNGQLSHSLLHWIPAVLRMHKTQNGRSNTYYNRDLMELLDLSVGWLLSIEQVHKLQSALLEVSKGYWSQPALERIGWFDEAPKAWISIFSISDAAKILESIISIVDRIAETNVKLADDVTVILMRMEEAVAQNKSLNDASVLSWLWQLEMPQLMTQAIQNEDGELQLLLMTDTRALDFEHIIIPGINEGSLPKRAELDSFIPLDLRAMHRMHLPQDVEASYGYVFYRLLQRSKSITLLSGAVDPQSKELELSRYVHQIKAELLPINSKIVWKEKSFRLPMLVPPGLPSPLSSDWSKSRIETMIQRGLSASAINKYRECPLDFYFRYIAKLDERQELDETMSDAEMGVLVHAVLEEFYGRFVNSYPSDSDFEELITHVDAALIRAQEKEKMEVDITSGYNALIHLAAKQMLEKYLKFEQTQLKTLPEDRIVVAVEHEFNVLLDKDTGLRFRGFIDRIERHGSTLRILDYKTGKLDPHDYTLKPPSNGSVATQFQSNKLVQLVIYMLAAEQMELKPVTIEAGFISMRAISQGWKMLVNSYNGEDWKQLFIDQMNIYLGEIRTMDVWTHSSKSLYCTYCESLGYHLSKEVEQVPEIETKKTSE